MTGLLDSTMERLYTYSHDAINDQGLRWADTHRRQLFLGWGREKMGEGGGGGGTFQIVGLHITRESAAHWEKKKS